MEAILNFCLNHLGSVMAGGSGLIVAVMSVIQVSKIEINPQSFIAAKLGNALNAGVMKEIKDIKTEQEETRKKLDEHIEESEERKTDTYRSRILRFNNELLRPIRHTKEEFVEVLGYIDKYEHYCEKNPEYPNSRAEIAIENIREVYKVRLKKRDFLQDEDKKEVTAL